MQSHLSYECMTKINDIEKLFKAHYKQMHRLAKALLHDDDLARDVVHDVFVTLLDSETPVSISAGYLISAVRNRCLNHIACLSTRRRIAEMLFLETEEYDTEEWPNDKTIARIYQIIKCDLSDQSRRAMELRYADGLTFAKVAGVMGISENAVYKHVRHALVTIRKKLIENGQI